MDVLHLLFPQWQGSGLTNELYKGAKVLQQRLQNYKFVEVDVSEKEDLYMEHGILGYAPIFSQLKQALKIVAQIKPQKIFAIGGGCDIEVVPISYLNNLYEGNLLIMWLDAHGDLNTPESSPSKSFHGMPLRVLLGEGDEQIVDFVSRPLKKNQVLLVGTRDSDVPEEEFLQRNRMVIHKVDEIKGLLEQTKIENAYIHVDLDVLSPDVYPWVKCPTPDGLQIQELKDVIAMINKIKKVVGGSVVEYVPGANQEGSDVAAKFYQSLVEPEVEK